MGTSPAHVRDHRSVLASAEKRVLLWIAVRLPRAVRSDHLSAVGFVSMLMVGASFAAFRISNVAAVGVVVFLAANWFGDSLDGTVARVRGEERPTYGYYLDHVLDLGGTAALMTGLACSGLMQPLIAAAVLGAYLLVAAETFLATHALRVFRMAQFGVGPTELRVLLAAGALRAMYSPAVSWRLVGTFRLFDIAGVCAIVGLTALFVISGVHNVQLLYRAEPLPRRT
jgi:archaetidylinositol phosphate synthase